MSEHPIPFTHPVTDPDSPPPLPPLVPAPNELMVELDPPMILAGSIHTLASHQKICTGRVIRCGPCAFHEHDFKGSDAHPAADDYVVLRETGGSMISWGEGINPDDNKTRYSRIFIFLQPDQVIAYFLPNTPLSVRRSMRPEF